MLICVFSDSHGDTGLMTEVLKRIRPDAAIHLGDFARDAKEAFRRAGVPLYYIVRGNCDFNSEFPTEALCKFNEHLFFLTHGHKYGVKLGLGRLASAAKAKEADIALFGHTHIPKDTVIDGVRIFNPGSVSFPRKGTPSYGIIEIKNGVASFSHGD